MNFERGIEDIKKSIGIGLYYTCEAMLKRHNGMLFNRDQTQQMDNFGSDDFWKDYPPPATAADFMEPWLLNKFSSHSIVIGITKDEKYVVLKNINKKNPLQRYQIFSLHNLHKFLNLYYS